VNISVIVSACTPNGNTYGERLFDERYPTLEAARAQGESKSALGMSVIIRPNYNERDAKGDYFREWRSFNGEPFKECRWDNMIRY